MKLNDVLFGEPEYDNGGNVIKRNMGLNNVLVWLFLFYVFQKYSFIGSTKQKGGSDPESIVRPATAEQTESVTEDQQSPKSLLGGKESAIALVVVAIVGAVAFHFVIIWSDQNAASTAQPDARESNIPSRTIGSPPITGGV